MHELVQRTTIMAVGVGNYTDAQFRHLEGPAHDIKGLRELLVRNPATALFKPDQFIELRDPTSSELRESINYYVMGRSAEQDILVFYFSGHGAAIVGDDFGFCATDAIVHTATSQVLPLSVVKLSEVLASIAAAHIIPVFIIDACYSGAAGHALTVPPDQAITNIREKLQRSVASAYALFCACSADQAAWDTPDGGAFSRKLFDVATEGLPLDEANSPLLSLADVYPKLNAELLQEGIDMVPRLYLGDTLPRFPLVQNSQFEFRRYSLSPSYMCILRKLWNGGNPTSLSPNQIGKLCGHGAYCNHNKLSFAPWALLETVPGSRNRRLTARGIDFLKGNVRIPKTVLEDPSTGQVNPAENSELIGYRQTRRNVKAKAAAI